MRSTMLILAGAAALTLASAGGAAAAVIVGPALTQYDSAWTVSGLGFSVLRNTTLTGFTFVNQGNADTVVLTDSAGNILDQISTPAGNTSDTISVNWALTGGDQYYLLQTGGTNGVFANYGSTLPSNADIAITLSGDFDFTVAGAAANSQGWISNAYWADFNNITTGTAVPEPSTWIELLCGLALAGYLVRRRAATSSAIV